MEANMAMKQEHSGMSMDMGNVRYWLENQVVLTFLSDRDSSNFTPDQIIDSLQLDGLNQTLNRGPVSGKGRYNLKPFNETDVPGPRSSTPGQLDNEISSGTGLNSRIGKYLFSLPSTLPQSRGTLVISFFHVESLDQPQQDSTPGLVDLLNSVHGDYNTSDAKFIASMPNWLNGGTTNGTDLVTHGCPTMPPIQIEDSCNRWKYNLPQQFSLPRNGTGQGVTVFVLDTLPKIEDVTSAANDPGSSNSLLSSMVQNMVSVGSDGIVFSPGALRATPPAIKVNYNILPDALDVVSPVQPATGKDIYGRLVGFPMADHGLFVAGIIRDLAPDAYIECIRVLNDYGVGNTTALIDALSTIARRLEANPLEPEGNLVGQRVVINMSLVATPADEELEQFGYTLDTIKPARLALLMIMELLAARGVVFAASAGNDSDPNDTPPMNPNGLRSGPRYPAAFANPGVSDTGLAVMIPVGAVDVLGNPAKYSNYPGPYGIATYGGQRPQPAPATPGATVTNIILPIDAPRGVYSSTLYPALAKEDTEPFQSSPPFGYPEHLRDGFSTWAYWVGTSFATPVISALAARILETRQSIDPSVRDIILNAATQQASQSTTTWDRLEPDNETVPGPLILVTQDCQSET